MKLVNKHRRLWMESCSEAIFPHEEVEKQVKTQYEILHQSYDNFYESVIEPHYVKNDPIIGSLQTQMAEYINFTLYSAQYHPFMDIKSVEKVKPYVSVGDYTDKGYCRINTIHRHGSRDGYTRLVVNNNQPKKPGYLGNKTNSELQLYLTDEQAETYNKARERVEQLKELHDRNMQQIAMILASCSTHKQLLEKAPGVYMNMPREIKQLHDNAAQRKIKAQAKAKTENSIDNVDEAANVMVPEELDSALAVAAFIKQ